MRKSRIPDLGVGLAVIQQGTRLTDYEVMLEVNIPWQTDIIRANVNEAQAMSDAASARREAASAQLQSELGQNWASLEALREQAQIVRSTLMPQVEPDLRIRAGQLPDRPRRLHDAARCAAPDPAHAARPAEGRPGTADAARRDRAHRREDL